MNWCMTMVRNLCPTTRRDHHCVLDVGHYGRCVCSHGFTLKKVKKS